MNTEDILHEKFNPRSDQMLPKRIKGFNRVKLAQLFAELGYKKGAEVGVADGRNAFTLCDNIPGLELHLVDPWEKYKGNPRGGGTTQQHYNWDKAHERLEGFDVHFHRGKSIDVYKEFHEGDLDFVYIDGNHRFDYIVIDLILWNPIVHKSGIVSGHDYYRFKHAGIVEAMDSYTRAHQIYEWFVDDTRETSFFYAKGNWRY